jgi:hypothetical protein
VDGSDVGDGGEPLAQDDVAGKRGDGRVGPGDTMNVSW